MTHHPENDYEQVTILKSERVNKGVAYFFFIETTPFYWSVAKR